MTEIIVAFPRAEDNKTVKNILLRNGCRVVATALSGAAAINQADELGGGIIVCAYRFADMVYSRLRQLLGGNFEMILVCSPSRLEEPLMEGVFFLPMPLKVQELVDTVEMLNAKNLRLRRKNRNIRSGREQELIARAKQLIMERNGMSEEAAHRYLQKRSMESGTGIIDTAQMIISLNEAWEAE